MSATKGGGFGSGPWGGAPWGGNAPKDEPIEPAETVTITEGLTVDLPLKLLSATAVTSFVVELTFSYDLDPGFGPLTAPANYNIPSLTVTGAALSGPRTVRLQTSEQGSSVYTVTVDQARSVATDLLSPLFDTATFTGFPLLPFFFATAQSDTKVMLTFSAPMLVNADFTSAVNYSVRDFQGTVIPVTSASAQGVAPVSRVTLGLGSPLTKGGYYVAEVTSLVKTQTGLSMTTPTDVFQWAPMQNALVGALSIPIRDFSGEVSGGLLGQPAGLVYFSPALDTAVANSTIQVDEMALCTRAFDVYEFPNLPDPNPLFTFGSGPLTTLGAAGVVLWAPADRLGQARVQLSDTREDVFPIPIDGLTEMTLFEPIDTTRGGFLNDARWALNVGVATSFSTYDNSTPAGPGPAEYLRAPYDLVVASETAATNASVTVFLSDSVSTTDTVGLEKLVVLSDSVAAVDNGDLFLTGGWTAEFSPEFE